MRWQRFAAVALAAVLGAGGASAGLLKYQVITTGVWNYVSTLQNLRPSGLPGIAVIDTGTTPGRPVLRRFTEVEDSTSTTHAPVLSGFIFVSTNRVEGPTGDFAGTGSSASTIAWGVVTGWTVTGTLWCNSAPTFICSLADRAHRESSEPWVYSSFYDLGTWTFHGTGFTATPFVFRTIEHSGNYAGNLQHVYRGLRVLDSTVPALPPVGFVLLSGSLALGGRAAIRRRREQARSESALPPTWEL